MVQLPKRVKVDMFEMGGKFHAESKYIRTPYFDTPDLAMADHKKKLKIYRDMVR